MTQLEFATLYNKLVDKSIRYFEIKYGRYPFNLRISDMSEEGFVVSFYHLINNKEISQGCWISFKELGINF